MKARGVPQWQSHAFGLAIDGDFELAGWPASAVPAGMPRLTLELERNGSLGQLVAKGGRTIARRIGPAGGLEPDVIASPQGYLIDEGRFGLFEVSRGGRTVRCAPPRLAAWQWQRHLIGRVLPFASTLRGLEPWHAAGLALDGRAIVLAGNSGSGKSSLAATLTLAGAVLLADDVVALSFTGAEVLAYPGPGLVSLRLSTARQLTATELHSIGQTIGQDSHSLRLAVPRYEHPLPLAVVYLLQAVPPDRGVTLTLLKSPDPRQLLGSTFNLALTQPGRLTRQLDVCAAIARSVPVVEVTVPIGAGPRDVAARVLEDHRSGLRPTR